jgi:hypothetical protein
MNWRRRLEVALDPARSVEIEDERHFAVDTHEFGEGITWIGSPRLAHVNHQAQVAQKIIGTRTVEFDRSISLRLKRYATKNYRLFVLHGRVQLNCKRR